MLNAKKAKYAIWDSVLQCFDLASLSNDAPIAGFEGFAFRFVGFVAACLDGFVDQRFARSLADASVLMNVVLYKRVLSDLSLRLFRDCFFLFQRPGLARQFDRGLSFASF